MKTSPPPTRSSSGQPKKTPLMAAWNLFRAALASPMTLGFLLTLVVFGTSLNFYHIRGLQEHEKQKVARYRQSLFEIVEWFDLKNQDIRARFFLKQHIPSPEVALLAIDDRSVEEIGRWPWSREKIAFVVDEMMKYGAASIGFDIVFSEAQTENPSADQTLADTLEKYKDKVVLGGFAEGSYTTSSSPPFQDFCRNEAFKRSQAGTVFKPTFTFVVNDATNQFEDLEFDKIFDVLFPIIEQSAIDAAIKNRFHKSKIEDLSAYQTRQLPKIKENAAMEYCLSWLTPEDPLLETLKSEYLKTFANSKILAPLTLEEAISRLNRDSKPNPILQYQNWTLNVPLFQDKTDYTGAFNAEQDSDGTIRKASLLFRTGNRLGLSYIPSIALQSYLIAKGYRADIELDIDPLHPEQKIFSKFDIMNPKSEPEEMIARIPVDSQGRMFIDFAGPRNSYPYLPVRELFNGLETAEIEIAQLDPQTGTRITENRQVQKSEFIKGKSFIFGATAIGIYDLRVTALDKNFPGPETHVNTLGNLMLGHFLHSSSREKNFMLGFLLILGISLSFAISHLNALPGFAVTLLSYAGIVGIDFYFSQKGLIVTMVLPGLLIVSLYVVLFFYKYLTEEQKKKHLRSTFSKYVSPAVVDEILRDPENIELGGKKQKMSVFFSDVRGFTTISEKLEPTVLSDVLNRYLTPMTQIVFANKGTLDKYMGDAVMAFFGAPIAFPDHAHHACRCALQSLQKLKEIQKEFASQGLPEIDIGIGINTAEMSVGNMGSDIVRSYTVMGDAVNLGSRLEGINKEYGTRIIISQFTYEEIKNSFTCREIDKVRVKGKLEPVRIFELLCEGRPDETLQKLLESFQAGYQLYMEKNFTAAHLQFKKALEINPNDPPSQLFIERCEDFMNHPPPIEWDGVFVMKTK